MHIVYYHNVLEEPIDDLDLRCSRLSVQSFRKQMEFLKKNFRPVSLSELLARADGGDDDPDCVSVTFDDAYEGVGKFAAPVLESLEIPAAVFVVSGTLRQPDTPLHYEELELALRLSQEEFVEVPDLGIGRMKIVSSRGKALFLKKLKPQLKTVSDGRRAALQLSLLRALGVSRDGLTLNRSSRKLDVSQLKQLHSSGLWEIGGHTRTHRVLAQLPEDEARDEIRGCRDDLRELLQIEPRYFAYPYGKDVHIGKTFQLVGQAGFEAAFTTQAGTLAESLTDRYRLPRFDFLDLMGRQPPSMQQKARDFFYP